MHKTIMLGLCAAGLIASQNASSATLKCSDATGATRYDSWQYDGGPAPYPGMIVSSSSIVLNDKVLDQTSERETIRRRKPEAIFEYDYAARVEIGLTEIDGIILVGHSFGGFVVRLFASMYPEGMAGLILEETQHEDNLKELRNILKGKDLEAYDQMMIDVFREPEIPKTEADFRNVTREQVRKSKALPRMPFVVLTCPDRPKAMPPSFSAGAIEQMAKLDLALMNRVAASIPGGRHILVEGTGHYIHVDRPQVLIAPTADMIEHVRKKKVK